MKPVFLLALLAALLACQRGAPAPETRERPRVIALVQLTEVDRNTRKGFMEAMSALGYREGEQVIYLSAPPAGSADKLERLIRQHLAQKPDLFFVSSTPATLVAKQLTTASGGPPVLFAPVNDPLAAGIVKDLKHPGGHITGIRLPTGDDLRLQWLTRIAPHVKRVFLPYTGDDESALTSVQQATEAAGKLGLRLLPYPIPKDGSVADAIAALPADAEAIFLPRDSRVEAGIAAFVAIAEQRRLPICAPSRIQVEAGALFSYGYVHQDIGRQAARLADQILQGLPPGDLPVEMAENSLSINLRTALELGLHIPDDVLLQADFLIRE